MKTQYTALMDLAQDLQAQDEAKTDVVVDTREMRMVDDGRVIIPGADDDSGVFDATSNAHRQIGQFCNIPAKYYDRCKADSGFLLAGNVNHWLHNREAPARRLIRAFKQGPVSPGGNTMRAFLSDRYHRIDNWDIANQAATVLGDIDGIEFRAMALTESRMHIKVTSKLVQGEVKEGDLVEAGVAISNSEIGHGRVVVEPFIHRLVCLNGMKANVGGFMRNHLGGRLETVDGSTEIYQDDTRKAQDDTLLLEVRDHVQSCLDMGLFEQNLQKLREATDGEQIERPVKAVEVLAQKHTLSEAEKDGVLNHLIKDGDFSKYGVVQAVTRTSQDLEDYDRADQFEALGGVILDLNNNEWGEIAQAA